MPDLGTLVAHAFAKRWLLPIISVLLLLVAGTLLGNVPRFLADEALSEAVVSVLLGLLHGSLLDEQLLKVRGHPLLRAVPEVVAFDVAVEALELGLALP